MISLLWGKARQGALRFLFCFAVIFLSGFQNQAGAGSQYKPISAGKVSQDSQIKVAQEVARVLGVKNVLLSDVHYGSGKGGYYVCAFFAFEGKKFPFTAELYRGASKWRIVRQPNRKELLDRERGTSTYYAVHAACARNSVTLGRWSNLIKSSPARVSGGSHALTVVQREAVERGILKALHKKRISRSNRVKIISFVSRKHKGTLRYACGYARVGKTVFPFSGYLVTKKKHESFHLALSARSKKEFTSPLAFNATTNACRKEGFVMHSAL